MNQWLLLSVGPKIVNLKLTTFDYFTMFKWKVDQDMVLRKIIKEYSFYCFAEG